MLDAIEAEFNTSVESCYFIGDSLCDLQAALVKGCKPVLVKTGKGEKTLAQLADVQLQTGEVQVTAAQVQVFDHLAGAVDHILDQIHQPNA